MSLGEQHVALKPIKADGLYSREQIVDPDAGEITILRPVTSSGEPDIVRKVRFFSTIMMNVGGRPQTLGFELEVSSLEEAVRVWPERAKEAADKTTEELRDQQLKAKLALPPGARLHLDS